MVQWSTRAVSSAVVLSILIVATRRGLCSPSNDKSVFTFIIRGKRVKRTRGAPRNGGCLRACAHEHIVRGSAASPSIVYKQAT